MFGRVSSELTIQNLQLSQTSSILSVCSYLHTLQIIYPPSSSSKSTTTFHLYGDSFSPFFYFSSLNTITIQTQSFHSGYVVTPIYTTEFSFVRVVFHFPPPNLRFHNFITYRLKLPHKNNSIYSIHNNYEQQVDF